MTNKEQVYKDYINAKLKKLPIESVYTKHKITKQGMYFIIRKIENGNVPQIKLCTERSKFLCIWEHKYKLRVELLPNNREGGTILLLKKVIAEMKEEGFKPKMIASLIGKDRTTVIHHLRK